MLKFFKNGRIARIISVGRIGRIIMIVVIVMIVTIVMIVMIAMIVMIVMTVFSRVPECFSSQTVPVGFLRLYEQTKKYNRAAAAYVLSGRQTTIAYGAYQLQCTVPDT